MFTEDKVEKQIRMAQTLLFVNAAVWLLFGLISLVRMATGESAATSTLLVVAVLMFGNVAALLIAGIVVRKPQKRWFWLVTAVLLINIILTFTDQVGIFDLLTLLLDLLILSLIIANRAWFWRR